MLPAFLLSLREGLEIALLMGIVLGTISKFQRPELLRQAWFGAGSAAVASLGVAIFLHYIGASLEGRSEQIFEGLTMLMAAGVLTWMIFWMQRQSWYIKTQIETDVRQATLNRGGRAMFILAFLIVVREGIELSLFLTASAMASGGVQTILGALVGLVVAAILGWVLFATSIRLDVRVFFRVTSVLLIFFAAGLVAHGVHELNEAGLIPTIMEPVWDTSKLLGDEAGIGLLLKTLFGYNANPSLTEILAYFGFFISLLIGLRLSAIPRVTVEKIS